MDFQQRLDKAIERGQRIGTRRARTEAQRALNEQELQRLHAQYRLELSERIERCLGQVAERFPGFRFETLVGAQGWGAVITRDDLKMQSGRRANLFSRLEMVIRPFSAARVVELAAKGTVQNRELFNRTYFEELPDVDLEHFAELIDAWVIEYAEVFAARS